MGNRINTNKFEVFKENSLLNLDEGKGEFSEII